MDRKKLAGDLESLYQSFIKSYGHEPSGFHTVRQKEPPYIGVHFTGNGKEEHYSTGYSPDTYGSGKLDGLRFNVRLILGVKFLKRRLRPLGDLIAGRYSDIPLGD